MRVPLSRGAEGVGSPYSVQKKSTYDTGPCDTLVVGPGTCSVGETLEAGIYTIRSDEACDGRVQMAGAVGEALQEYALVGETCYTLYLAEGNVIALPERCRMRRVSCQPGFQTPFEKATISRRRFLLLIRVGRLLL